MPIAWLQMTRMAIVSCGGICPGENDVIRAIVLKALDYGVAETNIWGIRMGFSGFVSQKHKPIVLTRQASTVEDIHLEGGTILGTCESGECDVMAVVKRLDLWAVDQLFVIGGQHEMSAAGVIQKMCDQCDVQCAVIAIPKSIDNDFLILDKCFGFETCVEEAQKALLAAKMEASSAYRGIGLVKLMGRRSGFIAVKIRFDLDRVLAYVQRRLELRGHVVLCMSEGAGQFNEDCVETDVGHWMKQEIKMKLQDVDCKYIDPSYLIRSIPATSDDRVYCKMLAHGAVHAAFAGYTAVAVGQVNTHVVYLPLHILAQAPRQMDPQGELWNRMCAANGQPPFG
ncbi:hypothetical protein D9Q98_003278 [Chlorella vulgaris]|uniref:Phosphofructokinase domain-containing protein n=1 Tax=Chlorella vulgaris TaxID=3077 RepID=A0A9D4TTN3_CHLVU|nr:hypothetical protein D9Q98_003278 [Chlorella vulgaris]